MAPRKSIGPTPVSARPECGVTWAGVHSFEHLSSRPAGVKPGEESAVRTAAFHAKRRSLITPPSVAEGQLARRNVVTFGDRHSISARTVGYSLRGGRERRSSDEVLH